MYYSLHLKGDRGKPSRTTWKWKGPKEIIINTISITAWSMKIWMGDEAKCTYVTLNQPISQWHRKFCLNDHLMSTNTKHKVRMNLQIYLIKASQRFLYIFYSSHKWILQLYIYTNHQILIYTKTDCLGLGIINIINDIIQHHICNNG